MGISSIKILMRKNRSQIIWLILLLATIIVSRLLPHAPNFSPVASLILFATTYHLRAKNTYLLLPALFVADLLLGFYAWPIMLTVYLSWAAHYLIARWLKNKVNILTVTNAALISALLFFLTTNWAVWAFGDWYSRDFNGLISSYLMGVPFLANTLLSNLLFSGLLFGVYESYLYLQRQRARRLVIN